jgi:hypothetical protein
MTTSSNAPHNPQDLAHSINNQLALLSGHLSLLQLNDRLSEQDQEAITVMSQAVFLIDAQVKLLTALAQTNPKSR